VIDFALKKKEEKKISLSLSLFVWGLSLHKKITQSDRFVRQQQRQQQQRQQRQQQQQQRACKIGARI
jgi:hypothetical protein